MGFSAKILADSISPADIRLTTLELTYPRIIHAEFMTHRVFSRNAASSRAIPNHKLVQRVIDEPFIPDAWGSNQSGMQAGADLDAQTATTATDAWLWARDRMVEVSQTLTELGVHKQLANRLLEPFQWYTVIVTATEWSNFFGLRCHPDAQPQIQQIAKMARGVMEASAPQLIHYGGWHLPLVPDFLELQDAGYTLDEIKKISVGRCARVSYLTHDGVRDPHRDIELYERLVSSGHMSPLEHVATPVEDDYYHANFRGWMQMRRQLPNEADFSKRT